MSSMLAEFAAEDAARLLPELALDANKYTRGKLLVIGASGQYPAAPVMSALAAARSGAGYTALCVPELAAGIAHAHLLSVTVTALPEESGSLCALSADALQEPFAKAKAFVVGCGMGRSEAAAGFIGAFSRMPAACALPGVFDADALFLIAKDPAGFAAARQGCSLAVLTPHQGEAARLLGPGRKVCDPVADALELAERYSAVVVLKGPDTVVACPQGDVCAVTLGGAELAKAGTGDVLAGIIGALLAQGVEPYDAACLGAYLHAKAGAIAACEVGALSVMPEDLPLCVAKAIRSLEPLSGELAAAQEGAERRAML